MNSSPPARGRPRAFDRDAALDAAMRLFWTRGYEATSVADLAAAMRINPPSLYAAFGDKKRLFLEAVDRYQAVEGAALMRAVTEARTAREAMARMLATAAEVYAAPCNPPGCMVVLAATNCGTESADIDAELAGRRAAGRDTVRARLRAAADDGELPPGTDTTALADSFVAVLHGMVMAARDGLGAEALGGIARSAMSLWPGVGEPASH
jgi:AcrR family transcriptional regulator